MSTIRSAYSSVMMGLAGLTLAFCGLFLIDANAGDAPIRFGETLIDRIECLEVDNFQFSANKDDYAVVHVTECTDGGLVCSNFASFQFDQSVRLFDEAGNTIAENNSPESNNQDIGFRTELGEEKLEDHLYTISVNDINTNRGGRGTYSIFLQSTNNPQRADTLISGEPRTVALNTCGEVDTYTFDVTKGQLILISMTSIGLEDILPRLKLYAESGRAVALPDSGDINIVANSSGQYTLLAFSESNETGTYSLKLSLSDTDSCPTGDMNGDCKRTPADALCIMNAFLELPSCLD